MRLIAFIIFLNATLLLSQDDFFLDKRNYYDFGKKFHAEVHYLPSKYEDSTTALVLFRYSYDLISFQKFGINHPNNDAFYSVPKIEIEFEDNDGIIRSRILKQDTILEKNYEKTISKTDFLNSAETINLFNGKYKVKFRLSDQTKSNIKRVDLIDTLPNNYQLAEIIGSPIFVEVSNNESFNPYVIRNNIKFSSKTSKILIPVSFKDEFTKYFYSIKFVKGKKSGLSWSSNFNKEEFIIPRKNASIGIKKSTMNLISLGFNTLKTKAKAIQNGIVEIDLPVEEIVPGTYELMFVKNGTEDTLKSNFEVVWEDMPFILQRPRYAIEAMYYILNDEEYSNFLKSDDYSKEIIDYWAKEDPTKHTPYNESMVEFFKRVDYALFNFKTLSEANGIKTDRGKIHILYGKPTTTDRSLTNDKTLENWIYEHIKKKFIFEAKSNGIYKLIDMKDL